MIKFENLKRKCIRTQARRDTFERQEIDHKIRVSSISYKTYFSIQLQVF